MIKLKRFLKAFAIILSIMVVLVGAVLGASYIGTVYGPFMFFISIFVMAAFIGAISYAFDI